ncbi:hypothetical protein H1C71_005559 [Ictidomys tridecemlineatus]|nr:hypothetical protein H1C71_005559 [Ictidomys tridecemlineatus]
MLRLLLREEPAGCGHWSQAGSLRCELRTAWLEAVEDVQPLSPGPGIPLSSPEYRDQEAAARPKSLLLNIGVLHLREQEEEKKDPANPRILSVPREGTSPS